MSIYKRYSDKTSCMCFIIKDKNVFDKYMTIWEKVSNMIKTINSVFIHNKKGENLKAETIQVKRKLSIFLYNSNIVWFSL